MVEALAQDEGVAGSSLTNFTALHPWARHIILCLVLVQPKKTCPDIIERLLNGTLRIKINETNKTSISCHVGLLSFLLSEFGFYTKKILSLLF